MLILLFAWCFWRHHSKQSEEPGDDQEDENPVYGLYSIHADPMAEVEDTNEDYAEGDYWEGATRVTSNNSNYSFSKNQSDDN